MLDDTNEPQGVNFVKRESAFLAFDGDAAGIAAMFEGPVAQEGDVCELVCTKAGVPTLIKLRVVKRAEAAQN